MSAELHKIEDAARLAMADFDPPDRNVAVPHPIRLVTALITATAVCVALLAFALS